MPSKPQPQKAAKAADHVFLIDGSSYIFRAYFAMFKAAQARGRSFVRSDGLPVGAVMTFSNMLWKLLCEGLDGKKPTHVAVVFDAAGDGFRNQIYSEYKAHREAPPDELVPQFPLIREAVKAFGLVPIELAGYEADDLIATYAEQALAAGADVTIVAGDKDLMQLVRDGVAMYDPMPGNERRIGPAEVRDKFGVGPEQVADIQALIGDSIDNVPGVPGVGPKAASTLLAEFGSLEALVGAKSADELNAKLSERLAKLQQEIDKLAGEPVKISSAAQVGQVLAKRYGVKDLPPDKKGAPCADAETIERLAKAGNKFAELVQRARNVSRTIGASTQKVIEFAEQARLSKQLVLLDAKAPVETPLADFAVPDVDGRRALAFLKAMEFTAITRRVAEWTGVDANEIEPDPRLRPGSAFVRRQDASEADAQPPAPRTAPKAEEKPAEPQRTAGATPRVLAASRAREAKAALDRARYETVTDLRRLDAWIAQASERGLVALEIETTSSDPMRAELCGVALALGPNEAFYLPLAHRQAGDLLTGGGRVGGQISLADALARLKPLLEAPGVLKVGHDSKFDTVVLGRLGVEVAAHDDTMLMSYVLDAGRHGHGLDELSERYLSHKPLAFQELTGKGKGAICFDLVELAKATEYAGERADVKLRLWRVFKARLVAEGMTTVYETLERPLVAPLRRMERAGIAIDRQLLSRLSGEFAQTAARLEHEIAELAGQEFNPGSSKQLGDILFGKMGLPGATKTPTGAWSTRANILEELAEQGHALPKKILEWRQLTKLRSTYTDALPSYVHPQTGRVHTSFALASTTTGRLSSADPNLQNIPIRTEEGRKIRRAFVAEKGKKLVSADYSQIELRLLAEIADIAVLKQAFRDGLDIHAMTASEMFGIAIAGMPADVRRRAKAINFGIVYGISAFGLANQLGIGREEAGAYIKKYFERFPGIRDYIEETKAFCRKHGYVATLFGRKSHYPGISDKNPSVRAFNERAAINARLQGTAADIIRRAMVRIDPALEAAKLSGRMLLQVHDELVFEVPAAEVERTLPVVAKVMAEAPLPAVSLSLPLKVDARAADNWDEAH